MANRPHLLLPGFTHNRLRLGHSILLSIVGFVIRHIIARSHVHMTTARKLGEVPCSRSRTVTSSTKIGASGFLLCRERVPSASPGSLTPGSCLFHISVRHLYRVHTRQSFLLCLRFQPDNRSMLYVAVFVPPFLTRSATGLRQRDYIGVALREYASA